MIHLQIDTYEEINSFEDIYKFINCMVEIKNYYEISITDNVEIYELRPQNYNLTIIVIWDKNFGNKFVQIYNKDFENIFNHSEMQNGWYSIS